MPQAKLRFASFTDYLSYSNETAIDGRYELIDGELIELPPESPENDFIAQELFWLLALIQLVPRQLIRPHSCKVQVPILQAKGAANRYPDLVILRPET